MKEKVMNGLEKFSKAMLSPLSYISAAGLILVLGALLTSTSLSAMIPVLQWTPIKLLGQLIYNCIMVIINNLSLMFCVGIAAALAKKNKQAPAAVCPPCRWGTPPGYSWAGPASGRWPEWEWETEPRAWCGPPRR